MIVGQTNHKKIQAIKISAINKNAKIFIILYFYFYFDYTFLHLWLLIILLINKSYL